MATSAREALPAPPGLLVFLAVQGLRQSRLTTILLIAAVAAGVGFQIPNTANLRGYRAELIAQGVTTGLGDVRVRPARGLVFRKAAPLAAGLRHAPGVHAVAEVLAASGSAASADRQFPAPVFGVDPAASRQPFRFLSGDRLAPGDAEGVLLGVGLAQRLRAQVGSVIEVRAILGNPLSPSAIEQIQELCALGLPIDCSRPGEAVRLRTWPLTVRGIVGGVFSAYEAMFVDLGFLRRESGLPEAASMLLVYGDDAAGARALASRLGPMAEGADVVAWMDDSQYLQSSVASVDAIAAVSHAMVVSAVVLPVWALLYVNVLGRRREIALLGALGLGRGEIFVVFLLQALIVGLAGAALGCVLGGLLVGWFVRHPIFEWYGFVIRPEMTVRAFVEPALVVLGAAVLAGVVPAVRASRLDPARVLRSL